MSEKYSDNNYFPDPGKNLDTWSSYIRKVMHTDYWWGADFVKKGDTRYERYMNPVTIEKYMETVNTETEPAIANAQSPIN